jgi:hypothetical protein
MSQPTLEDYAAALPTSVPLDERQVFNAIHDPNVVNIRDIQRAHQENEAMQRKEAEKTWQHLLESTKEKRVQPTPVESPSRPTLSAKEHPTFVSSTQDAALRAIGHMLHDIKHYDTLPLDSHSKKLKHCFVENYRIYATLMAVLIIVVFCAMVGLCFMPSHLVPNTKPRQEDRYIKNSAQSIFSKPTKHASSNPNPKRKSKSSFGANSF